LVASDPSLKGRITINIVEPDGTVYWYIRFNTLLDEATVCKKTMNITDTKGYILNSLITYDATRNLIILNPMDLYRPNENYILNISKKVRSLSGKYLKKPVHIMFKLVNNKMTEFEILKSTAEVPKPRKKPHSVKREEIKELMDARAIAAGKERVSKKNEVKPTLPYGTIGIKIHLSAIGLLLMVASLFTQNTNIILGGMALAVLGLAHVLLQLRKKTVLSSLNYAFGVSRFNKGNYQQAQKLFERAITQDPRNDLAEYAADKVEHYV
jgi:tetratricopeptide (TPR) repeat protein